MNFCRKRKVCWLLFMSTTKYEHSVKLRNCLLGQCKFHDNVQLVKFLPSSHPLVIVVDEGDSEVGNNLFLVGEIDKTVNVGFQAQLRCNRLEQRTFGLVASIAGNSGELLVEIQVEK